MNEQLYINGKDAYLNWGVSLLEGGYTALMAPLPLKARIENKSRLEHGKRVITPKPENIRYDERDITLQFSLRAKDAAQFDISYAKFLEELYKGEVVLRTARQPDVYYHLQYDSCQQFAGYVTGRCLGKFTIRFNEPNPKFRTITEEKA